MTTCVSQLHIIQRLFYETLLRGEFPSHAGPKPHSSPAFVIPNHHLVPFCCRRSLPPLSASGFCSASWSSDSCSRVSSSQRSYHHPAGLSSFTATHPGLGLSFLLFFICFLSSSTHSVPLWLLHPFSSLL